jgi:hypothetical protein
MRAHFIFVNKSKWLLLPAMVMALGAFSARADSGLIDINFFTTVNGNGSAATGAAVIGSSNDVWNGFDGGSDPGDGPLPLFDSASNATPVTLTYSSMGGVGPLNSNIQPNASLMTDYIFNNTNGAITLSLQNLTPNTTYDLYVYLSSNDAGGSDRAALVTANGVFANATGDPQTSFIDDENYLLLTPTSDGSGTINITEAPGAANSSQEVDLNGIQLALVPEPCTLALLVAGSATLVAFRTSKRKL